MAKRDAIMSTMKQLSKLQSERLTKIEEEFLDMKELPNEVRFLQTQLEMFKEKVREIDALNA